MVINWHTSEESSFIDVDTCSGKFGLEYGRLQIDGDNGFKSEIDYNGVFNIKDEPAVH
jgi:hypothetical protein